MTALVRDRNTAQQIATILSVALAANAKVFAGGLTVVNASGWGVPGGTATNLTYVGRAEETVDNTGGANGAKSVPVRRLQAFKWVNDGSINQAHLMKTAYIVDDQTVAATDGTGTRSPAGRIVGIEADGVWVE
ncbi:hypothetical protein [Pseudomonas sp. F(2018)]|uniref:hypothetical protein n=1 Tax=Pseudomonas sp. F(2018) TaxID=2502240 RepID=UPI0010F8012E|nr:hypothetical protein [Pseudomonas sp. F(2018)]